MQISRSFENEIVVLNIQGRLWQEADSADLLNMVNDIINHGHLKIIIDLSEVPIMNSSGLGSLIATMKTVKAASGDIVLYGINDRLMNLLRITKLLNIFDIFHLKDDAIDHLKP